MSAMKSTYYDEGIVESVNRDELVTNECIVRVGRILSVRRRLTLDQDIDTYTATPKSLNFQVPFHLMSTCTATTTVRAFLTYFDTFFSSRQGPSSQVPAEQAVQDTSYQTDEYERMAGIVEGHGNGTEVSFTSGPSGQETHWKQMVFLLREPIVLEPGR